MKQKYGIIFLDGKEVVIRVYEVTKTQWSLFYYHSFQLQENTYKSPIVAETLAEFFLSKYAQGVTEWKVCAREVAPAIISDVANAIGQSIETITPLREQELLCKGIFTELW